MDKGHQPLSEQLKALGRLIADILQNPEAPDKLKRLLEMFAYKSRSLLSPEQEQEIEKLEFTVLLPEILNKVR
jgi:hypothetical protein